MRAERKRDLEWGTGVLVTQVVTDIPRCGI